MNGLLYQKSWIFNLSLGYNQISINETVSYRQGTMVLLQMISGVVSLSNQSTLPLMDYDYMVNGNETDTFSLLALTSCLNCFFQLIVVTTRYSYQNSLYITQEFDYQGLYNLTAVIFDPRTQIVYLTKNYKINGKSFLILY